MPPPLAAALAGLDGDPRDDLAAVARLGFRHVQLSATRAGLRPRDLDRTARRGLGERLKQLELSLSGVDLWIPPGHFADAAHVDRAVGAVQAAVVFAADLGGVPVSMVLPATQAPASAPEAEGETTQAIEASPAAEAIAALVRHAERHGVALVDHAVPPWADACAAEGAVRLGIDVAAWLAQGLDPVGAAARHGAALACVRLSDLDVSGMRTPLGDAKARNGRLDVLALAATLDVVGFGRPVVADPRQWPNPWGGLASTLEVWRGLA